MLGSAEPGSAAYDRAGEAGRLLAQLGVTVVSGCGSPATRHAAEQALEAGGEVLSIIPAAEMPAADWPGTVVVPSGIGDARNLLMALAGDACVVIGGRAGTISEVCLAWLHHRPLLPLVGCGGWSEQLPNHPPDERGNASILPWQTAHELAAHLRSLGLVTPADPLHIGIVGCSAEGAALCYRTICAEGQALLGAHAHPQVSMHTPSLADYVARLEASDLEGVASLMLDSAHRLARAGARFLVCPDNTIHQAMHLVQPRSPLPWLHIAQVVAQEAARRGYRRLGLTGTHWLVQSAVYPEACEAAGLACVMPPPAQRERMSRYIMDELVQGVFSDGCVRFFQTLIEDFKAAGCDAVVLGCTEIPLVIHDDNSALPVLDSTRLLARAAVQRACGADAGSMQINRLEHP